MNGNVHNEGMFLAKDGTWISFGYDMWDGRVVSVFFFEHKGLSEPQFTWFLEAA